MKNAYTTPKAVHVDFNYEEKVTASSGGNPGSNVGNYYGNYQNYCQISYYGCMIMWTSNSAVCSLDADSFGF